MYVKLKDISGKNILTEGTRQAFSASAAFNSTFKTFIPDKNLHGARNVCSIQNGTRIVTSPPLLHRSRHTQSVPLPSLFSIEHTLRLIGYAFLISHNRHFASCLVASFKMQFYIDIGWKAREAMILIVIFINTFTQTMYVLCASVCTKLIQEQVTKGNLVQFSIKHFVIIIIKNVQQDKRRRITEQNEQYRDSFVPFSIAFIHCMLHTYQ